MKIAILQMDVAIGNPEFNFAKAKEMVEKAATEKPDVVILPEMWNTGYALDRAKEIADVDGKNTRELFSALAKEHKTTIIAGSVLYHNSNDDDVTNTMLVFNPDGTEALRYDKLHLFRLMDEDEYLSAGNTLGMLDINGTTVGAMICYDLRFPQLSRKLVHSGAKVIVNVAQWPTVRLDHWKSLIVARAIENQSYFVAVNRCGTSNGTNFPGNSMVVDPWGQVLLQGNNQEEIYFVDIDINEVDKIRKTIPVFDDQRFDMY